MSNKKEENRFYVYVYLDPRKPGNYIYGEHEFNYEPFYVGKGTKYRYNDHIRLANNIIKNNILNKKKSHNINKIIQILNNNLKPIILKLQDKLFESEAFLLEEKMIITIGRNDLKKGPLTNKTNGKDGVSGYIYPEQRKNIMSKLMSGKNNPMFGKKRELSPNFGTKWSKNRTKIMTEKLSGENNPMYKKTHTNKVRKKLSKNHLGLTNKKYKLISPEGEIFYAYNGLTEFCFKHNLSQSKLSLVVNGKRKHHKGWKCEYI